MEKLMIKVRVEFNENVNPLPSLVDLCGDIEEIVINRYTHVEGNGIVVSLVSPNDIQIVQSMLDNCDDVVSYKLSNIDSQK